MQPLPPFSKWLNQLSPQEKNCYIGMGKGVPYSQLFPQKVLSPFLPVEPIASDEARDIYIDAMKLEPWEKAPSIYLNFFEKQPDLFDQDHFKNFPFQQVKPYHKALVQELENNADHEAFEYNNVQALSIDGGWLKNLSPDDFVFTIDKVRELYALSNDVEISVNILQEDFQIEKLHALYEAGVTTLNFSSVIIDPDEIQRNHLPYNPFDILNTIDQISQDGHLNTSIHLQYGYPKQKLKNWHRDLNVLRSSNVDALCIEQLPPSVFTSPNNTQGFPNKDKNFMMHEIVDEVLNRGKAQRRSNNYYSLTGRHRNTFVENTISHQPIFSYGLNACTTVGAFQWINTHHLEYYINHQIKPIDHAFQLQHNHNLYNQIIQQLRSGYLDIFQLQQLHEMNFSEFIIPLFDRWEDQDLISQSHQYIHLTTAGRYWWINLAQILINIFSQFLENNSKYS